MNAAPGPVTDFTATPDAGDIDLAWTNPTDADLAGVLIVRGEGVPVTFAPTDGTTYTVGMAAGTGQEVLFVGTGTTASLPAAVPGVAYAFSAWAFDAAGQFSVVAETTATSNTLGTQTGQIEIALDGTVTVTQQPANLTLAGTAVVSLGAGTIDLDLGVTNETGRLIFNLKGLTDDASDGTVGGPTFPVVGGLPSTYYGPEALDTAALATRTINLTGITGTVDPVVLDVHFVDAPMLFSHDAASNTPVLTLADSSGSVNGGAPAYPDQNNFYNALRTGAISADGRRVYAGHKSEPVVVSFDTTTLAPTISADLSTNAFGSVGGVAIAPDGTVYALVNDGAHWWGTDGQGSGTAAAAAAVSLVKLNPTTLAVTATLPLVTAGVNGEVGRTLAISPDGSRVVAALSAGGHTSTDPGSLYFVDAAGFTVIDTDAVAAGVQPVALTESAVADLAFMGDELFVTHDLPVTLDQMEVVDTTTFAVTTQALMSTSARMTAARPLGNRVLLARRNRSGETTAVTSYDPATDMETVIDPGFTEVLGLVASADGARYFVWGSTDECAVFDAATDTRLDTDGDATNGVTNFEMLNTNRHFMVISPF